MALESIDKVKSDSAKTPENKIEHKIYASELSQTLQKDGLS